MLFSLSDAGGWCFVWFSDDWWLVWCLVFLMLVAGVLFSLSGDWLPMCCLL